MDDIYTFGQKAYVSAEPVQRSIFHTLKNFFFIFITSVKCTILGFFIVLKSILFLVIPLRTKDIQYSVALVTGGGNGIGRAIAIELAKYGCNIAVADVDVQGSLETVEELNLLGVKAYSYEVDVANYDEIVSLKEKIKKDLGDVDILINNAGVLPRVSLLQGNPEDILRIMKVNLLSHFWTIRVFLPSMIAKGRGHVVGISSAMAYESTGRAMSYSSSKFGVRGLMDGLYDLIRIDNLKLNVTTVVPPLVNTRKEFIDKFINNDGMNPVTDLLFYTPKEVAVAAVDGIIKNKKYVVIPPLYTSMINFVSLLPEEFQDIIRDSFKPNVRAEVNGPEKIQPPASLYLNNGTNGIEH